MDQLVCIHTEMTDCTFFRMMLLRVEKTWIFKALFNSIWEKWFCCNAPSVNWFVPPVNFLILTQISFSKIDDRKSMISEMRNHFLYEMNFKMKRNCMKIFT